MKRLVLGPDGWPCLLGECRPGLFVFEGETVCIKTDYGADAFLEGGDAFWGGASTAEDRAALTVQPVVSEWQEYEE